MCATNAVIASILQIYESKKKYNNFHFQRSQFLLSINMEVRDIVHFVLT